ncbi:MAG: transcriptional regulator [Ignavibacteria bacterium GWB2_35_12]|nr:MAG: transcriptional regulator [Ignavibacteria bacterium GWA2_35_8]OGU40623.1 MAG: transcriptional regulator [Ignavibacteria bacterium GWB2_35_12]OGU91687.1 MAG: transcriptional regulator [Ignavibacteria bacterium RIFOXYA2_FULL_35_10]OGV22657.1 MAG: transcriptional regulator [Ignavibacteria bacterium RIFOXYC2_FULL_35_21]
MPQISRFFGIIISMFYNEHSPPHFHADYGEFNAEISIRDLVIINGILPPRALGLVIEWASQHKSELLENWDLAESKQVLKRIEPLM